MKNHTPKSATYTIYLSTDSFQLQPGALDGVGWMKKGGGTGGGTGRTGERKTGTVGPQYPRP